VKTFQLLSDLESGTICYQNCNTRISALDYSETCWNRISLGFSDLVSNGAWRLFDYCAVEALLLTYLQPVAASSFRRGGSSCLSAAPVEMCGLTISATRPVPVVDDAYPYHTRPALKISTPDYIGTGDFLILALSAICMIWTVDMNLKPFSDIPYIIVISSRMPK